MEGNMKTFNVVISTSEAHKIEIEANSHEEAIQKAQELDTDQIKELSYDSWGVDGFPMVVDCKED